MSELFTRLIYSVADGLRSFGAGYTVCICIGIGLLFLEFLQG